MASVAEPPDRPGAGGDWSGAPAPGTGSEARPDGSGAARTSPLGPPLGLPKGGGAIRSIGEKLTTNVATGTAGLRIGVPVSPGRAGLTPNLGLTYDSGRGNGVFGLGWSLDVPQISRRTDQGLPRYDDTDTFVLSGAEDLVPIPGGPDTTTATGWKITRFRPRVEGLFARIERWVDAAGDTHWRVLTADNVLHTYGTGEHTRIADPEDTSRVFAWLLRDSRDDRGNVVHYRYRPDDGTGIDLSRPSEANRGDRDDQRRAVNRYLTAVRYANRTPLLDGTGHRPRFVTDDELDAQRFLLELVLDYGEHDEDDPTPDDDHGWPLRPDPFSVHRARFEVRTTRRCRRFLMFHHIPDTPAAPGYDAVVRSLELTYADDAPDAEAGAPTPGYSALVAVTETGWRRTPDGYLRRSRPPLELSYSQPQIDGSVRHVADAANLTAGLVGYEWTDVHGDGVPGLLARTDQAWYYLANRSPLSAPDAEFTPAAALRLYPRAGAHAQLLDLAGDGLPDLVTFDGPVPGLSEHDDGDGWGPFRPFASPLPVSSTDPDLRLLDLDGDAHADALLTAGNELWWFPSLGEDGFGPKRAVTLSGDEEKGPVGRFGDPRGELQVADMSGDGLADLVRIRSGEICYWPNLGDGRFGARITMDHSPTLDRPDQFDPRRVRLADVDGSGTTDLIYLHGDGVRLWFNESGNGWSEPVDLPFPAPDDVADVTVLDLLGTGTACLVWSSPLPGGARRPLRYLQLLTTKPHLLTSVHNNLGTTTTVAYAPSTRFALADRLAGQPWLTRLPFPVHVVERVEVSDRVSRTRVTTSYRYHHGCFDGAEREFAGFAMVETIEAEEETNPAAPARIWSPPTLTRTWFHTGTGHLPADWPTGQGWTGDPQSEPARAVTEPAALRALRGQVLRTEVLGLDGSPAADLPYAVTHNVLTARQLQAPDPGSVPPRPGVFLPVPSEQVTATYERAADDPRIRHDLTLEVDDFGNVLRSMSVCYPRRTPAVEPGLPAWAAATATALQGAAVIRATQAAFTTPLTDPHTHPDDHRTPLPARRVEAVLTWPGLPDDRLVRRSEADAAWAAAQANPIDADLVTAHDLDPTAPADPAGWRVVTDELVRYRSDDLSTLLAVGAMQPLAIPGNTFRLALTEAQLTDVLDGLADEAAMAEAGYQRLPGESGWWAGQDRVFYSPDAAATPAAELAEARAHFFLPRRLTDPHGGHDTVTFDPHGLLRTTVTDPVGNTTVAVNDYRVLAPARMTEPAGARSEAAFDALGAVAGVAMLGTDDEPTGDTLTGFVADLAPDIEQALFDDLAGTGAALASATTRTVSDHDAYLRTRDAAEPQAAATLVIGRERHVSDDPGAALQLMLSHVDGLGREVQRKTLAEPGPVPDGGPDADPRWVGSSWVVHDAAGEPVQTFEPFFSRTHRFEPGRREGLDTTVVRDPLRRVVGRLHPDGSWEKTVIAAWRQEAWDRADTVLVDDVRTDATLGPALTRLLGPAPDPGAGLDQGYVSWRARRLAGEVGSSPAEVAAEQDAAAKAATLAGTPAVSLLDPAGRLGMAVTDAGPDGRLPQRAGLDARGAPLQVTDPMRRRVVEQVTRTTTAIRSGLDGLGHALARTGLDAGRHLALTDALGHPVRTRDARGVTLRWRYDAARRPTHLFARTGAGPETLMQRWVYGEGVAGANAAGRLFRTYDSAGLTEHSHYDERGNITASARRLVRDHRGTPDWSATATATTATAVAAAAEPLLEPVTFRRRTWYDAIGRPVQTTSWSTDTIRPNVLRHGYGAGGLLDRLDAWLDRPAEPTGLLDPATADLHVLTDLTYDAHGRTLSQQRGNGTVTSYVHDPATTRLRRMTTTRPTLPAAERVVADYGYSHDPLGNVTRIRDDADPTGVVFFRNRRVSGDQDFTYDHLYRLVRATGREHVGLAGAGAAPPTPTGPDDAPRTGQPLPSDGHGLTTYTETYRYDAVGGLQELTHETAEGRWRRGFSHAELSALDPAQTGNRLTATGPAATDPATWTERYTYDQAGAALAMPALASMTWDAGGRLVATAAQVTAAPGAVPETTHYDYDGDGQRLRLTIDRAAGPGAQPTPRVQRITLPGLDVDRELAPDGTVTLQRQTLHIAVGDQTVAVVETRTVGTDAGPARSVRHQYANHLGSATLTLAADGAILHREEYYPYGGTAHSAATAAVESPHRDRFLGRPRDPSGLYLIGVRYYAPWLGRWLSPDPAETADGLNAYLYAHANPVTLRDTDGREVEAYYIAPGRPGNQPWMWFLGLSAHNLIAYHYVGYHLQEKKGIYTNFYPVSTILTDARIGDPSRLTPKEANSKPDITNVSSREVFEIKPWNSQGEADARKEVRDYQSALNKGMGVPPGGRGSSGPSRYPFLLGQGADGQLAVQFLGGRMVWRLTWKTTEDGVVLYKWQKTSKTDRDEIKEAGEGQWVDITEADAQAYGEALHQEVEKGLGRRQKLFTMMDVVNTVQVAVGTIAVSVLMGAMLGARPNMQPRPTIPAPAPRITPPIAPPPAPPPVVVPTPPANVPPPWMIPPPGAGGPTLRPPM